MKTDQFSRAPRPHSAFQFDRIPIGDSRTLLGGVPNTSVDLSFWSPPYFVGKSYEKDWSFSDWEELMRSVIFEHSRILKPGCFLAINIADILCFPDPQIPRFQANNVQGKIHSVTRSDVLRMKREFPDASRNELAKLLGCSEQTVQRRIEGNNVRGEKKTPLPRRYCSLDA